jgi:capsular exopolysaccharide synthesis family protein
MQEKKKSITLGDIFHVLWKNIILLAVITGCVFVIGEIYTFAIAKPTYKTNAAITVAIDYVSESTHQTTYDYTNSIRAVVTVADTIKNNSIIDPVVERYNEDLKDGNNTLVLPSYKLKYPLDESKWQTVSSTGLKEMTSKSLSEMVSVSYTTNSMMVTITVAAKNPIVSEYFADAIQTKCIEEATKAKEDCTKGVFLFTDGTIVASSEAKEGEYASPNKKLYIIIAFLIGLVLGVIVIFVKDFMFNKFITKAEIEASFDEKIVGVFQDRTLKKEQKDNKDVFLVDASIRSFEPYNKLLSNIKYSNLENPYKVIEFTSTLSDELKSTTAANLAFCMANNNNKVIIVDLDIRKAVLHKTFKVSKEAGIVDYIAGDITKEEFIKHTESGVDIITVGKDVINTVAVLETSKIKELIEELRNEYDYVIFDTPPCLACSDDQIDAQYADGIIFSLALNQAKKKDILECLNALNGVDASIIGISITKAESNEHDSYYYYYGNNEDK